MIPFKSPLLLTVPPTLEKRLEALAALRTLQAQDEELVRQRRAAIAALRRDFDKLQRDFAALRRRLGSDVRSDVLRTLKYNPDQPRVPAGQSGGGQWTSEGGSGSSSDSMARPVADEHPSSGRGPQYAALETDVVSDAPTSPTPQDSTEQRIQVAGNDWRNLPVNLAEEEAPNGPGHAIREHVGKTEDELRAEFPPDVHTWLEDFLGKRVGSFDSIENANDLVNRLLRANSDKVDAVANGQVGRIYIEYRFGSDTGYELYRPDPDTHELEIRRTYAVAVVLEHDPRSPRGFRVITAFPMNIDP
jgi:hypothetical protein